jgi:hypothetical protein
MHRYRKLLSAPIAAAGLVTLFLGSQTAAQAQVLRTQAASPAQTSGGGSSDGYAWVEQDTSYGSCYADVAWSGLVSKNSPAYAYGRFVNYEAGWTCTGWLERSTNGGSSWSAVSGSHALASLSDSDTSAVTDNYYDGPGYLARACFQFSFSGAAIHCSPAI